MNVKDWPKALYDSHTNKITYLKIHNYGKFSLIILHLYNFALKTTELQFELLICPWIFSLAFHRNAWKIKNKQLWHIPKFTFYADHVTI